MRKISRLVFVALTVSLCGTGFAEEKAPAAEVPAAKIIPPSARSMVKKAVKSMGAEILAAQVRDTSVTAYGFTSTMSDEKGSFKIGVLVADLEATMRAGDREKVSKGVVALEEGLAQLGAPVPLMMAVINMGVAVNAGVDLQAVNKASLPLIKPFLEEFITRAGNMPYLRFGEWVESTRLVMLSGEGEKGPLAGEFLRGFNLAGYFLEEMKDRGLPVGVMNSLKEVAALEKGENSGLKEVGAALKAVSTIYEIMG